MKFDTFLLLFFCIGILHLFCIAIDFSKGRQLTKILLIPFLMLWTVTVRPFPLLLSALFFGWLGDVLLIRKDERLFLKFGLLAFLMGHIAYISIFWSHLHHFPAFSTIVGICVVYSVFGFGIFRILRSGLGRMILPVAFYIFAISVMSASALMFALSNGGNSWWAFGASLLFVFSDSILALQLFRKPFKYGRFIVMATYIPAQFLLVWGVLFR